MGDMTMRFLIFSLPMRPSLKRVGNLVPLDILFSFLKYDFMNLGYVLSFIAN